MNKGTAQDSSSELIARIEARQSPNRQGLDPFTLQEVMQKYRVPGVSVAVINDFGIDWAAAQLSFLVFLACSASWR